jgi:hypothetical protein
MSAAGGSITDRMMGAAFLKVDTFEEVEHDENATGQAALVVAMVAVAEAIGASGNGPWLAIGAAVSALVAWVVWAGVTYLVGTKAFEGTATWGELLRTLGFAQAPGVLWLFGWFPLVGWILNMILPIWIAVAGFIAIRQALDFGNGKTFLTILVGWGIYSALHILF